MLILVWISAVVGALIILWFLFKSFLGFTVPPETTGKAYLRKQLKEIGVANEVVPDECIEELVQIAIKNAKFDKGMGKYFNNSFVEGLDVMADTIRIWIHNSNDIMFKPVAGEKNLYREIFKRYKVPSQN